MAANFLRLRRGRGRTGYHPTYRISIGYPPLSPLGRRSAWRTGQILCAEIFTCANPVEDGPREEVEERSVVLCMAAPTSASSTQCAAYWRGFIQARRSPFKRHAPRAARLNWRSTPVIRTRHSHSCSLVPNASAIAAIASPRRRRTISASRGINIAAASQSASALASSEYLRFLTLSLGSLRTANQSFVMRHYALAPL